MTERIRKILRGKNITPKTADEAAVKYAVENGGGGKPFAINATLDVDGDTDTETMTLDKTAEELYAAVSGGVLCKLTITATAEAHDHEITLTTVIITPCSCSRTEYNGEVSYNFFVTGGDGKRFAVEDLSGDDTVVVVSE